jgi:hypothetical protein
MYCAGRIWSAHDWSFSLLVVKKRRIEWRLVGPHPGVVVVLVRSLAKQLPDVSLRCRGLFRGQQLSLTIF